MIALSLPDLRAFEIKMDYLMQIMADLEGIYRKRHIAHPHDAIQQINARILTLQHMPLYDHRTADAIDHTIALALAVKSSVVAMPTKH